MIDAGISSRIAQARVKFRPPQISVLFVGESPPANETFFYFGNNNLLRHFQAVVGGPQEDQAFLESFMRRGWFLDDLVATPVDRLSKPERTKICRDARPDLAARIAQYRPQAIVSLLNSVHQDVIAAAKIAGSEARLFGLPFAGHGHQSRFREKLRGLLPELMNRGRPIDYAG